jgi:uncharacterized protein YqjF (DUF2071 family)
MNVRPADPIDRLSPSRRPQQPVIMYQRWRTLTFVHWSLPAEPLRALLPSGLELDLYEGQAYVGLVAFTMRGVRPAGFPSVPWLSNFHETNVRTYVHFHGRDPGVVFFSLEAANPVAVVLARTFFHLRYHHAGMSLDRQGEPAGISYTSERRWPGPLPARSALRCVPKGQAAPAETGTLAHFLIERYLLYTTRGGRLCQGQVHHTPYPIQDAVIDSLDETLLAAAGLQRPNTTPLIHFSEGVDVEIFSLQRVDAS